MPRLVGINHVALEVESVDDALEFYGRIFDLELRGRASRMAFIDIGDQFIALMEPGAGEYERHFGLVVDDKDATRRALAAAGAEILPGRRLDARDPFGNRIQVVQYDQIQFTKAAAVLSAMRLKLDKTPQALAELRAKGIS